jgi:hypothetical protein
VHVAVDDATRLAYVEVLDDEKGPTAAGFLRRAVRFFGRYGIRVERILTDNGACYRAVVHALACRALGIKHLRTRPYRPRTNGKAERFIRTLIDGWGLRRRLPHQQRPHRRPRRLARLVQPTQTTPLTQPQTTTHPARRDEQPCRDQQLGRKTACEVTRVSRRLGVESGRGRPSWAAPLGSL